MNDEWPDPRKIEDMRFGSEWEPKLGYFVALQPWLDGDKPAERMRDIPTQEALDSWKSAHADKLERLNGLLHRCEIETADDIVKLGCTGAAASGLSNDDIKFLRTGIAGGGVGLPCLVPPDRYCLAHDTIGGLQKGQAQGLPELIEQISRELTPLEAGSSKLVSAAMRARGEDKMHGAFEILQGDKQPDDWASADVAAPVAQSVVAAPWKCPEHAKINWSCRYCVAQALVEGDLVPSYTAIEEHPTGQPVMPAEFASGTVVQRIADSDAADVSKLSLFVRVATFTRKLSRD